MLWETGFQFEVGADLVAFLVHRNASKRQSLRVSARAIIATSNPHHFSRQKTFSSLKLQEGPADIHDGTPPAFPKKETKLDGRRVLAAKSKAASRPTTCVNHKWVPHFQDKVCYTIVAPLPPLPPLPLLPPLPPLFKRRVQVSEHLSGGVLPGMLDHGTPS